LGQCSVTKNRSTLNVTAFKNWVCDWGSTGSTSTGCAGAPTWTVRPGERTPSGQDWDVLRVDAGYCYKVAVFDVYVNATRTYDRRGRSALFIKVGNTGTLTVLAQSSSSCP
jgi:hypothetical protein